MILCLKERADCKIAGFVFGIFLQLAQIFYKKIKEIQKRHRICKIGVTIHSDCLAFRAEMRGAYDNSGKSGTV